MATTIELKLYATLAQHQPDTAAAYPVTAGTSVGQLIDSLGIDPEHVRLVFIDGRKQDQSTLLQGGERVGLFPPVGGG
jgi:molybdopterin converting factor small subunit